MALAFIRILSFELLQTFWLEHSDVEERTAFLSQFELMEVDDIADYFVTITLTPEIKEKMCVLLDT